MGAETVTLARLLLMAALTAATIEYAELIRRRFARQVEARDRDSLQEHGLQGLVRVLLAD